MLLRLVLKMTKATATVYRGVADDGIVDRVPDGAHGQDGPRGENGDLQYVGQKEKVIETLELVYDVVRRGEGSKSQFSPNFNGWIRFIYYLKYRAGPAAAAFPGGGP
jgi:hypothetical protein